MFVAGGEGVAGDLVGLQLLLQLTAQLTDLVLGRTDRNGSAHGAYNRTPDNDLLLNSGPKISLIISNQNGEIT